MADLLALPTLDHDVLGLNPVGGRILLLSVALHCTEPFVISIPLSLYDLNNVERGVKHQMVIFQNCFAQEVTVNQKLCKNITLKLQATYDLDIC